MNGNLLETNSLGLHMTLKIKPTSYVSALLVCRPLLCCSKFYDGYFFVHFVRSFEDKDMSSNANELTQ
jgi:hypothetical protein